MSCRGEPHLPGLGLLMFDMGVRSLLGQPAGFVIVLVSVTSASYGPHSEGGQKACSGEGGE